ncbi:MazG nucleotide pyrophosphohydrolase domain-containing protein [Maritalea porphyrae]|jgi:NTP pyrophosphatase (non-canonical NTP hydrolase)|uniref:MazG nucleotide pyrophosphohydrolase domain-containing protein n=1 Tax=Maritalea porphyrae TaxID=880732 RepID=UPI0022B00DC2|nr:MazG nucleotide pyrophosphohydrolase domain-containing protein [Maritalea porphyrae]MCZ4273545.1 hypothetical protein [Maritalea porphyrae]
MMTVSEDQKLEALTILVEECAEIIQAVSKVKRFGVDTTNADTGEKNGFALTKELADLLGVIRLAEKHGAIDPPSEEMIECAMARKQSYSSL